MRDWIIETLNTIAFFLIMALYGDGPDHRRRSEILVTAPGDCRPPQTWRKSHLSDSE